MSKRPAFWKEVGAAYRTSTTDFNELFGEAANDPRYEDINPSVIVEHITAKLYDMWKSVNGKFVKALAKFNVSGQNANEFYGVCDSDLKVLYLRVCTGVKPELMDFVSGGMHERRRNRLAQFDCVGETCWVGKIVELARPSAHDDQSYGRHLCKDSTICCSSLNE